jgi:tetratricopeptide (TPR) repeat protein
MIEQGPIDSQEVESALEAVLARREFAQAPRQCAFLRYVVAEKLAQREDRLKAFTIATNVFGRGDNFDAQNDSIVRVEALRLRRMLEQYYDTHGARDPVEIRLTKGSYVPQFLRRAPDRQGAAFDTADAPNGAAPVSLQAVQVAHRFSRWGTFLAGAAVAIVAAGALYAFAPAEADPPAGAAEPPPLVLHATLAVSPLQVGSSDPRFIALASRLDHQIADKLSRFDNPKVFEATHSGASRTDYELSGTVEPRGEDRVALALRVTRRSPGGAKEIVWVRRIADAPLSSLQTADSPELTSVTTALGQSYGAIHADMRRQMHRAAKPRLGYECVVLAYDSFDSPSARSLDQAEDCLTRTLARAPAYASGNAALSYVEVTRWLEGLPSRAQGDLLKRARALSRAAIKSAPERSRAHAAVFWAQFFSGRHERGLDAARLALRLNPNATDTLARYGIALILLGRTDEGLAALTKAGSARALRPLWEEFFLFLADYAEGKSSLKQYVQARDQFTPLGFVEQIVLANRGRDFKRARQWRERLESAFPGFARDISASLKRWQMRDDLRMRLLADLEATG